MPSSAGSSTEGGTYNTGDAMDHWIALWHMLCSHEDRVVGFEGMVDAHSTV